MEFVDVQDSRIFVFKNWKEEKIVEIRSVVPWDIFAYSLVK